MLRLPNPHEGEEDPGGTRSGYIITKTTLSPAFKYVSNEAEI